MSMSTSCPVCGAELALVAVTRPPADPELLWTGYPWTAQVDVANPKMGVESIPGSIYPDGPYRSINCLNNGYSYTETFSGGLRLEVRPGDKPPGAGGGYRAALLINDAIEPYRDILGNGDGLERYIRHEFRIDDPDVTHINNWGELHGNVDGSSPFCFAPNGAGDHVGLKLFAPDGSGTRWYDEQKLGAILGIPQVFVLNYRLSIDPFAGFFRLYRLIGEEWSCRTLGAPGADEDGRVFTQTQQITTDGEVVKMAWSVELYCSQQLPGPRVAVFGDCRIGRTLESIGPQIATLT